MARTGILFVLSAPSGTGKSTVVQGLLERMAGLDFSVSYTTRERREGEREGRHYHFVTREVFQRMIEERAFLEWATVFGELYGTGRKVTEEALARGTQMLLDVDVEGAAQIRHSGVPCVSVILLPPDYATLEARLRARKSESAEQLRERLARARREVQRYPEFDYVVVNDRVEEAVEHVCAVVRAEQARTSRCSELAASVLSTFPA